MINQLEIVCGHVDYISHYMDRQIVIKAEDVKLQDLVDNIISQSSVEQVLDCIYNEKILNYIKGELQ